MALSALSENVGSVIISLGWGSPTGEGDADVSVLLLDLNGKVRSDTDFYFYNNPVAADGSVQLLGKTPTADGNEDRISFDLTAVPADVDRIVVAASRYNGGRFGALEDVRLSLADGAGEDLLRFAVDDVDSMSAIIFGELYRRDEEWKFRAVGQGYATGLGGLAMDFGVDIEDDAEAVEAQDNTAIDDQEDTKTPGDEPSPQRTPEAVPSPRQPEDGGESRKRTARPRTAKKKVTLPKVAKRSLAENESWREARLFPVSALKSDRDREMRATSVLLSVMAQVPEFGRRLTAAFGAPAGRMETFTEVTLPHGDTPRRPDGVIRVERAGKLWTALVETKYCPCSAPGGERIQGHAGAASPISSASMESCRPNCASRGHPASWRSARISVRANCALPSRSLHQSRATPCPGRNGSFGAWPTHQRLSTSKPLSMGSKVARGAPWNGSARNRRTCCRRATAPASAASACL